MSRKSRFTAEEKRAACRMLKQGQSISGVANSLGLNKSTLKRWRKEYEWHGEKAFERPQGNRSYPREYKVQLVKEYYREKLSIIELAAKHQIGSTVIAGWIEMWDNGEKLDDYHLYPGVYAMTIRKTTVEERLEIVQWVMDHGFNYTAAAARFELKYATIYQWTQRYLQEGKEGLQRKRGRKPKQVMDPSLLTETQRLQLELEELKKLNYRLDLENRVLKKKQEIERRNRTIR